MSRTTFRVLVTGSRKWTAIGPVMGALDEIRKLCVQRGRLMVVRHGDCPAGPDNMAKVWCIRTGAEYDEDAPVRPVREDPWPARWHLGRTAGIDRNQDMVDAGADICLAFIKDASPGATHCASRAVVAGIPVAEWTMTGDEMSLPGDGWIHLTGLP